MSSTLDALKRLLDAARGERTEQAAVLVAPAAKPFVVDATVKAWKQRVRLRDLERVHFTYPPTRVEAIRGPEIIDAGEEADVRFAIPTTMRFGPGSLRRGDVTSLDTAAIEYVGRLKVRNVVPLGADPDDPATWKAKWGSVLDVEPEAQRKVRCPACDIRFSLDDRWAWTGVRHSVCGQKLNIVGVENQVEPVWCLMGNIVDERTAGHGGEEVWYGTKHFSPGTKIYCYPPLWGDGYERVQVLGQPRQGRDLIKVIIKGEWIKNRRAKLVYAPSVVDRLSGHWDGSASSKKLAEALVQGPRGA